jgi:hypothetical protein
MSLTTLDNKTKIPQTKNQATSLEVAYKIILYQY